MIARISSSLAALVVLASATTHAVAFELHTHGAMTAAAVSRSRIADKPASFGLFSQLGLMAWLYGEGGSTNPFGATYLDLGATIVPRDLLKIENDVIEGLARQPSIPLPPSEGGNLAIPSFASLGGWVMRGAIREDDNTIDNGTNAKPEDRSDEPGGVFDRVLGHFFDPVQNQGLWGIYPRAVDWALSADASIGLAQRKNHFKATDARESMWRSLTLKRVTESGTLGEDVFPAQWGTSPAMRESLRRAYWASTFRALGDVLHLVQDMAQPQHTRNDAHAGLGCIPGAACLGGHASFFEHFLDSRSRKRDFFTLREGFTSPPPAPDLIPVPIATLVYFGYAPPELPSYANYFSSGTGATANADGKGLANYSSRGFYSAGTNIGSLAGLSYPLPSPFGSGLATETLSWPDLKDISGKQITGTVRFKTGSVADTVTGTSESNVKLATVGPWDQFLQQKNPNWSGATLNHYNYDDQARLLVPRAVGYSAGLINYFFRGSMQISLPDDGVYAVMDQSLFTPVNSSSGFTKVKLKLANNTPAIGTGPGSAQDMTGGRLVAVAKFRRMKSTYSTDLSGDCGATGQTIQSCRGDVEDIIVSSGVTLPNGSPVTSATLVSGAAPQEFHFTFSEAIPLNVTDLYLQVVYRGALGSEADAVVVTTKNVPEPTYLGVYNMTDSLACFNGAWVKLNADGSVPSAIAAEIVAASLNPANLAPQPFERSSVTFRGPFTYPLSDQSPLTTTNSIAPGTFYRLAILTEDNTNFDWDIQNYWFFPPSSFSTATNGTDYDSGSANTMTSLLTKVRDSNAYLYRFGYRYVGGHCNDTPSPPIDAIAANGGRFLTPTIVPVGVVNF